MSILGQNRKRSDYSLLTTYLRSKQSLQFGFAEHAVLYLQVCRCLKCIVKGVFTHQDLQMFGLTFDKICELFSPT